jgi:predicted Zn-dependent protease with MMP-like domain
MVKLDMRYEASNVAERLQRRQFERLVERVVAMLPPGIMPLVNNVEIVIEDEPARDQLSDESEELFGLYQGTPQTERGVSYGMTLPDKITIFRGPIERVSDSRAELAHQIRVTIIHEIAHHFGIDEQRIADLGYE